jgi:hypothetical protein
MTTKWTPGPWKAYGTAIHAESGAVAGAAMMNKQANANARLIAAAPEMAELLAMVARSACLDQRVGNKCICFSCESKPILARINGED